MPIFNRSIPEYKPGKDLLFDWPTFRRGLNLLLKDNEIRGDELAQADNIVLIGAGVPTKRWGTKLYHQAGNVTGSVRGLKGFYKSNGTVELLGLTDDGYLTRRSNASYAILTGVSWASGPSGVQTYMAQLEDSIYIVNGRRELVRYSNPTLVGFPTIAIPVITGATNLSNASGTTTKGYRLSAISQVGETLAAGTFELRSQPAVLGGTAGGVVRLTWTGVSTASGILQGFNVYGRTSGSERFLAGVPAASTFFDDNGSAIPREFILTPTADSTGGPIAKYVIRFQDRLIFTGLDNEPTKVLISGRAPDHERFDWSYGGAFTDIEPDAGDNITGIYGFSDRIIVFKEKSIWQITLDSEQIGNFFITVPVIKLITNSYGCIASRSITAVENDLYFFSRRGVYSLGLQEGFLADVLRTLEISVKVRSFFQNLTTPQKENAVATYFDNKYLIAFPGKDQMMIFDRERVAWSGPWNLDATVFETFYDADNDEHLLFAQEGTVNVDEFSSTFADDKSVAISTTLRTRNEDFGDWSLFKNIRNLFIQMRNVTGSVTTDIRVEQRTGATNTAKSFNITPRSGNSGWGADQWGKAVWGDSEARGGGVEGVFTIRWANLNSTGRLMALTFRTTAIDANYELMGIRGDAKTVGKGYIPSTWRI